MPGKISRRAIVALLSPIALALALIGAFTYANTATAAPRNDAGTTSTAVQNDVFWKDTSGNPIYSQGGGVIKVGDTYYWYGAKYNGAVTYYDNPSAGKNSDVSFSAITCYSSTDLVHWTFVGNAMTSSDLGGGWVGRVGIAHNPNTGKYVLLAQDGGGLMFATSSTPAGHFSLAATQSSISGVSTGMSGDQSVFVDDNGQAYLAFSNKNGRTNLYVAALRPSDYLQVEAASNIYNSSSGGREGNIMFKHGSTYYFCSSDLHGWNASHTYCISSSKVAGSYSSEFVMQGTDADFSHVTQSGLAFAVNGTSGSFVVFGGDRWSDFAGNGIGYNEWEPVTFNGTTPTFHSLSQWNVDPVAGTWSVGSGNNYVLNPSVEADRVSTSAMAGWSDTSDVANHVGGHTGHWSIQESASSAYSADIHQNITLPNGTYTLSAWIKSSGGQNSANLYAKNFGGSEMDSSINHSISGWTQVSISNVNVTNGSIQVGVSSNANAGNYVDADDFSLTGVSSGSPSPSPSTSSSASTSASPSASASSGGGSPGEVHAVGAGRCLDVPGATQTNGTQLDIYDCTGGSGQLFTYTSSRQLTVYDGAKCVDAYAKGTAAGTKVDLYDCNGGTNQQWNINTNGTITGVQSGLCLDVTNAATTNGTPVELYTCNSGTNQKWTF